MSELLRGYQEREDAVWFREAWVVAHITAPHMKHAYEIDKLLSFRTQARQVARYRSKADARREFLALKAQVEGALTPR